MHRIEELMPNGQQGMNNRHFTRETNTPHMVNIMKVYDKFLKISEINKTIDKPCSQYLTIKWSNDDSYMVN